MLRLCLPQIEVWDPAKEQFDLKGGREVELEHSLYTISGWEAKYKKPFTQKGSLDRDSLLDYICNFMCQTPGVPAEEWLTINESFLKQVMNYMDDKACATTVKHRQTKPGRRETVTAELLYYYMTQFGIPFECERWHVNKLMTLIDVCAVKSSPPQKMSRKEAAALQHKQNLAARAKYGSKG